MCSQIVVWLQLRVLAYLLTWQRKKAL